MKTDAGLWLDGLWCEQWLELAQQVITLQDHPLTAQGEDETGDDRRLHGGGSVIKKGSVEHKELKERLLKTT